MADLRPPIQRVLDSLLVETREGERLTLDRIGGALGVEIASTADIEALFVALEKSGRAIADDDAGGGHGEARLKKVVTAARDLRAELGRTATQAEIAARASLTVEQVKLALALARVMQR